MKYWLISITGSILLVALLGTLGRYYPEIEPWSLVPGIYVAILFPGVHAGDLRVAALVYNLVIYSIVIYSIWWLMSDKRTKR